MKATMALAKFAAQLRYEHIPPKCLARVKEAFLDSLGCGLFGSTLDSPQKVNSLIKEMAGREESTLWLNNFKGPAANAAFVWEQ